MKLYHATPIKNLDSIRQYGLHPTYDGIYFSENPMSALKWVSMRGEGQYALVEITTKGRKGLKYGTDHHPVMEMMFPGRVWVSQEPRHEISKVLVYDVKLSSDGKPGRIMLVDEFCSFSAENKNDNPFRKNTISAEQLYEEVRNYLQSRK